jgi:hypothetical protein
MRRWARGALLVAFGLLIVLTAVFPDGSDPSITRTIRWILVVAVVVLGIVSVVLQVQQHRELRRSADRPPR